jgi:hypothetical protein
MRGTVTTSTGDMPKSTTFRIACSVALLPSGGFERTTSQLISSYSQRCPLGYWQLAPAAKRLAKRSLEPNDMSNIMGYEVPACARQATPV